MSLPRRRPGSPRHEDGTAEADLAARERALKDYKVAVEYKHLWQHAPSGVYVVPHLDDLRTWHGVIFVRRGLYAGGMFKFKVELPWAYGDPGVLPALSFNGSTVFNPLVDPATGELDLPLMLPDWDSANGDCMLKVITYMKKIFYTKDFALATPANPEAQRLFREDRAAFAQRAAECAQDSLARRYESPAGSCLRFTEPRPAHEALAARILGPPPPHAPSSVEQSVKPSPEQRVEPSPTPGAALPRPGAAAEEETLPPAPPQADGGGAPGAAAAAVAGEGGEGGGGVEQGHAGP